MASIVIQAAAADAQELIVTLIAPAHTDDLDHENVVENLVDETITCVTRFDLVRRVVAAQLCGGNVRVFCPTPQHFFELCSDC